ncbi:MAG TPA: helicase HerA-like domain-containing protein [Solirubrobacteraceae bacterium]
MAWPLFWAALSCAIRGRAAHRRDLEAGCDLAEAASRKRTVSQAFLLRARRAARDRASGRRARIRGGRLILGRDEVHGAVSVPFGGAGGRHTLVIGATGSGKTVTQSSIAAAAIADGMGAVVIDPKGDRRMREQLRVAAQAADRRFLEWTPQGCCAYNPYSVGSDTEIADKALAGERFTEPHYLRQAQRYLGHVVRALRASGGEVSLAGIVEHLDPGRLELLARAVPDSAEVTFDYLDSLTPRQRADLAGVRDRLAILVESDVGPWLDTNTRGARPLELRHCVRERDVVYFDLEADRRPLVSQMIAAAIIQDLQTTVSMLQDEPVPTIVVIDEFAALATDQVVRLFGRARSAGLSLLLGTQELSDLRLPGRERLLEQIVGNLSVLIAHRQVVPASAETVAALAGTVGAWKVSHHSNGRTVRTRTRELIVDPSRITSLAPGWAAVLVLEAPASIHITRVHPSTTGG